MFDPDDVKVKDFLTTIKLGYDALMEIEIDENYRQQEALIDFQQYQVNLLGDDCEGFTIFGGNYPLFIIIDEAKNFNIKKLPKYLPYKESYKKSLEWFRVEVYQADGKDYCCECFSFTILMDRINEYLVRIWWLLSDQLKAKGFEEYPNIITHEGYYYKSNVTIDQAQSILTYISDAYEIQRQSGRNLQTRSGKNNESTNSQGENNTRGKAYPISIKDIAKYLNCSPSTIKRWINKGKCPYTKLFPSDFYDATSVYHWIAECMEEKRISQANRDAFKRKYENQ